MIGDLGSHCLSYLYYVLERDVSDVFCRLDYAIKDRPAPTAEGGFRLDARGDTGQRIPNTADDTASVLFKLVGGGSGHIEDSRVATGLRFAIGHHIVGRACYVTTAATSMICSFTGRRDREASESVGSCDKRQGQRQPRRRSGCGSMIPRPTFSDASPDSEGDCRKTVAPRYEMMQASIPHWTNIDRRNVGVARENSHEKYQVD
jgi:hypothetical protein